jgi:hypothetical protein
MLERDLDAMYINSSVIFGQKYVRSVVIKFMRGKYVLRHLTSTTTTTTTTPRVNTTTTKPPRYPELLWTHSKRIIHRMQAQHAL